METGQGGGVMYHGPMVSVVMPAYNVEKYLYDAVRSLQMQSYKNWELIVVDDASTDDTLSFFRRLASRYARIKVIELQKNSGVAHARNVGLNYAKGKYLYLLDSDDYITGNAFEELVELAEWEQLDEITFETSIEGDVQNLTTLSQYIVPRHQYEHRDILTGSAMFIELSKTYDHSFLTGRCFYRREVLRNNKILFCEYMSAFEDDLFYYQAMLVMNRVKAINKQYHFYRIRENSLTTKMYAEKCEQILSGHIMNYVERDKFLHNHDFLKAEHQHLYKMQDEYYYNTILKVYACYQKENNGKLLLPKVEYEAMLNRLERDFNTKNVMLSLLKISAKNKSILMIGDENYRQIVMDRFHVFTNLYQCIYDDKYHIDINALVDKIKTAKGLVLLFTVMYNEIKNIVIDLGLQENRDFIDGRLLL